MTRASHIGLLVLAMGCGDPGPGAPGPSEFDVLGAADFLVRVHDFNWEIQGSTVYELEASGRLLYIHPEMVEGDGGPRLSWRETSAQLEAGEVRQLRVLARPLPALQARYVEPNLADGVITTFWLRSSGQLKEVYCQNRCPDAAGEVLRWLRARAGEIPTPHAERAGNEAPGMRWSGAHEAEERSHE